MENNWFEKLFLNEAKPALKRHSGSGGGSSSGGEEFNIAYGDTPPEDTSKLWVKGCTPKVVSVTPTMGDPNTKRIYISNTGLPRATTQIASAAAGQFAYIFGGASGDYLYDIRKFDIETEVLTTLSSRLPNRGANRSASAIGSKIYIIGGRGNSYLDTILMFDTMTETITTLTTTWANPQYCHSSEAVMSNVYIFGGKTSSRIYRFDTESGIITTLLPTFPDTARYSMASTVVGDNIYLFGGMYASAVDTIHKFDTASEVMSTLNTKLPAAMYGLAAETIANRVYLFGGVDNGNELWDTISVFNPVDNSVTTLDITLPNPSHGFSSALIRNKICLFGGFIGEMGSSVAERSSTAQIRVFELGVLLEADKLALVASTSDNITNLSRSITLGVKSVLIGNSEGIAEPVEAYLYKDGAWTLI